MLNTTKKPEAWRHMHMVAPPALGEAQLINLHNLWNDVAIPIYSDATYLSWVLLSQY